MSIRRSLSLLYFLICLLSVVRFIRAHAFVLSGYIVYSRHPVIHRHAVHCVPHLVNLSAIRSPPAITNGNRNSEHVNFRRACVRTKKLRAVAKRWLAFSGCTKPTVILCRSNKTTFFSFHLLSARVFVHRSKNTYRVSGRSNVSASARFLRRPNCTIASAEMWWPLRIVCLLNVYASTQ